MYINKFFKLLKIPFIGAAVITMLVIFCIALVMLGLEYESLRRTRAALTQTMENTEFSKRFEKDANALAIKLNACHTNMESLAISETYGAETTIAEKRNTLYECKIEFQSQVTRIGEYLDDGLGSQRSAARVWTSRMWNLMDMAERSPRNPDIVRDSDAVKNLNKLIDDALGEKTALGG